MWTYLLPLAMSLAVPPRQATPSSQEVVTARKVILRDLPAGNEEARKQSRLMLPSLQQTSQDLELMLQRLSQEKKALPPVPPEFRAKPSEAERIRMNSYIVWCNGGVRAWFEDARPGKGQRRILSMDAFEPFYDAGKKTQALRQQATQQARPELKWRLIAREKELLLRTAHAPSLRNASPPLQRA